MSKVRSKEVNDLLNITKYVIEPRFQPRQSGSLAPPLNHYTESALIISKNSTRDTVDQRSSGTKAHSKVIVRLLGRVRSGQGFQGVGESGNSQEELCWGEISLSPQEKHWAAEK